MLYWVLIVHIVFTILITAQAAYVVLHNPDNARRADGYKVLRVVWSTSTSALVISVMAELHNVNLP